MLKYAWFWRAGPNPWEDISFEKQVWSIFELDDMIILESFFIYTRITHKYNINYFY